MNSLCQTYPCVQQLLRLSEKPQASNLSTKRGRELFCTDAGRPLQCWNSTVNCRPWTACANPLNASDSGCICGSRKLQRRSTRTTGRSRATWQTGARHCPGQRADHRALQRPIRVTCFSQKYSSPHKLRYLVVWQILSQPETMTTGEHALLKLKGPCYTDGLREQCDHEGRKHRATWQNNMSIPDNN